MQNYLEFKAKKLTAIENHEDENRFVVTVTKFGETGEKIATPYEFHLLALQDEIESARKHLESARKRLEELEALHADGVLAGAKKSLKV